MCQIQIGVSTQLYCLTRDGVPSLESGGKYESTRKKTSQVNMHCYDFFTTWY